MLRGSEGITQIFPDNFGTMIWATPDVLSKKWSNSIQIIQTWKPNSWLTFAHEKEDCAARIR